MQVSSDIKLAIAMLDQGFRPKVWGSTFASYLPVFIEESGGATEGAYIQMPQIPLERLERPRSEWTKGTYELKRYIDLLERFHPRHKPAGSFGAPGWGSAALFFAAAQACGAQLTRACILRYLETTGPFTANGFLYPSLPREQTIYSGGLIVQVRNGRFVEIRPFDKSGPREAPDFWNDEVLFNWQRFFCANQAKFPDPEGKKALIDEC
jgi:hypothetical protein